KGMANERALRRLVASGEAPGLIAYAGEEPIGWVAVAPREEYPRLASSRTLKPLDDTPLWSITCFFVAKGYRGQGVSGKLIRGAVAHARSRGARMIEGYPVVSKAGEDARRVCVDRAPLGVCARGVYGSGAAVALAADHAKGAAAAIA
ncbi:MAG TPA: GNAT family N-acetyltransferase, partial [Candidatus Limnocylindrales bacterium]|nr:GNAT family N-acetyltransferase [Candidatus Limnocylindrales bacterium]